MERGTHSPKSPIAALSDKLENFVKTAGDEKADVLFGLVDSIDAWVREDILSRLGRRADRDSAADAVFRAWHKLPNGRRADIAKLATNENCYAELEALVGNLSGGTEE